MIRFRLRTLLAMMTAACPVTALIGWLGFPQFACLAGAMLPVLIVPAIGVVRLWRNRR
jgi:hypothetical protein